MPRGNVKVGRLDSEASIAGRDATHAVKIKFALLVVHLDNRPVFSKHNALHFIACLIPAAGGIEIFLTVGVYVPADLSTLFWIQIMLEKDIPH